MGIWQGKNRLPPMSHPRHPMPACLLVCLTEPDDGIRSDRMSGTSGIVKPLFCAQAMRDATVPKKRTYVARTSVQ